jgi:hypothetical protein
MEGIQAIQVDKRESLVRPGGSSKRRATVAYVIYREPAVLGFDLVLYMLDSNSFSQKFQTMPGACE